MSQFHAKEGWYFERLEDGGVRVTFSNYHVDLDANTWASAVASVSAMGENAETFEAALEWHNRRTT
jgi:hypothetical protein